MRSNLFEKIHSGDFQDKIILGKMDAVVNITTEGNIVALLGAPFLEDVARSYRHRMKFYSLDPVQDQALCQVYGVQSAPAILFFKRGTLVDKLTGLVHRTLISAKVHALLNH